MGSTGRDLEDWLQRAGEKTDGRVHRNLRSAALIDAAVRRGEGQLADNGAITVRTGVKTGRSPNDKYVVSSAATEKEVWWGAAQSPVESAVFDRLLEKALGHLERNDIFTFDGFAGASPAARAAHPGGDRTRLAVPVRPHAVRAPDPRAADQPQARRSR